VESISSSSLKQPVCCCEVFSTVIIGNTVYVEAVVMPVVVGSLTGRSNVVEMPKSHDGSSVVASTCSSMPYATFIEAAESGSVDY